MRRSTRAVAFLLLVLFVPCSGCSYWCQYRIVGTVTNAVDGTPLQQVSIALSVSAYGTPTACTTDADGKFAMDFTVSPTEVDHSNDWTITVSADGYRTEKVTIGPVTEPASVKGTGYIFVHVQLQPARTP